jgi:hypothetical protein
MFKAVTNSFEAEAAHQITTKPAHRVPKIPCK